MPRTAKAHRANDPIQHTFLSAKAQWAMLGGMKGEKERELGYDGDTNESKEVDIERPQKERKGRVTRKGEPGAMSGGGGGRRRTLERW